VEYECDEECIFTSSTTLTAIWEDGVTLTLHVNGGYWGIDDEEDPPVYYTDDKEVVVEAESRVDIDDLPWPAHEDMAFAGWEDENEVLVIPRYFDESSFKATEDMDLYASWVPGVMVTFDLNGGNSYGSLSFSQVIEKDIIIGDHFYYGTGITPPAGKTFGGWSLKRNDKSTKISEYQLTQNVTLYALWNAPAAKPVNKAPTDQITISKAPSGVKAKAAKKGKATLTWKKFKQTKKTKAIWKKIKNVEVQYSTDKTFRTGVISKKLGKKKTKLTVKKLKAKTTYYFRVRYVEGPYKVSKWSAVKKVKAKK